MADDDFNEYRRMIIKELTDHGQDLKEIKADISDMKTNFTVMKVKVAFFGSAFAFIVTVLTNLAIMYVQIKP